jgi:hypothetical protein
VISTEKIRAKSPVLYPVISGVMCNNGQLRGTDRYEILEGGAAEFGSGSDAPMVRLGV